jgi:hypothetical protein
MIDDPDLRIEPGRRRLEDDPQEQTVQEPPEDEPTARRREASRLPTAEEAKAYRDKARALVSRADDSKKAAEDRLREAQERGLP